MLLIGQNIKKLRKERNLTQEELAEQLNVTPQAVSKWESGTGLPDITQVVPLAGVFGVSVDVLFGTYGTNDDEAVQAIIDRIHAQNRKGSYDENGRRNSHLAFARQTQDYDTLQQALKAYPSNLKLLNYSLGVGACYVHDCIRLKDDRADEVFKETVRIAHLIINYSKEITEIIEAHWWLMKVYSYVEDFTQAEYHANKLPSATWQLRGNALATIKIYADDHDGTIQHCCDHINDLLFILHFQMVYLGNAYTWKKQYENAIQVYESIFKLVDALYGDEEYTPPLHMPTQAYHWLVHCYMFKGESDRAMDWLEKALDKLLATQRHYNKRKHLTTPLLQACEYDFFAEAFNVKSYMLDGLLDMDWQDPALAPLRDTPRFQALLQRVTALEV